MCTRVDNYSDYYSDSEAGRTQIEWLYFSQTSLLLASISSNISDLYSEETRVIMSQNRNSDSRTTTDINT